MEIKEFLRLPKVQELLEEENIFKIYETLPEYFESMEASNELTEMFKRAGINPLQYMTIIPEGMFFGSGEFEINIPEGITSIEPSAFGCCDNLKIITLPKSLTYIDSMAFEDEVELVKVTYNGTVEEFDNIKRPVDVNAFVECTDGVCRWFTEVED